MRALLATMGILAAAAAPAFAEVPSLPAETLLTVSATGESTRVPDIATLSAGVVTQAVDARSALRDNSAQMTRVVAALKKIGIAERDIQTSNVSLNPNYRYRDNQSPELVGYQATNTVNVKLRNVAKTGDVIDTLVTEGANQVNGPMFALDKPEAAADEAREQAMQVARTRADLYARLAGMKVKRIVAINEAGGYQPPYPLAKFARAEADVTAAPPIAPGEVGTNVNITVVFELR